MRNRPLTCVANLNGLKVYSNLRLERTEVNPKHRTVTLFFSGGSTLELVSGKKTLATPHTKIEFEYPRRGLFRRDPVGQLLKGTLNKVTVSGDLEFV